MAGGGQQGVHGVASLTLEEVSVKPPVGFHMADGGFDGRSSPELAFHLRTQAPLMSREHDCGLALVIVAAIALVGIDPFRLGAGHIHCLGHGVGQGMAIVGVAAEGFGGQHQTFAIGGGDADLGPELVRGARLAPSP